MSICKISFLFSTLCCCSRAFAQITPQRPRLLHALALPRGGVKTQLQARLAAIEAMLGPQQKSATELSQELAVQPR